MLSSIIGFLYPVVISAILYANGEKASAGFKGFARRLVGAKGGEVATLAGRAVRRVAMGVVLSAIVQSGMSGIGLAITGIPAAS